MIERENTTPIGKKIASIRQGLGMTIKDLSAKSGVASIEIIHIEKGKRIPQARTLYKIASATGADIYELIELVDKNKQ